MAFSLSALRSWFHNHEAKIQSDFFYFLRFRSISTDKTYKGECFETANWLFSYLKEIGMKAELLESSGLPVVFAEKIKNSSYPTVLIYHHYDVQPVDPLELWKTDPFSPTVKEGKVFARGASDNKGQCFLTITALKAIGELFSDLPLNIKLFIEGEEESGGAGTHEVLQKHREKLKADYLCVIDFDIPSKSTPAVTLGYRGICTLGVECTNAGVDLHSGVHGGIALNPNRILVDILSKIWDENGKVRIPHFYDNVEKISDEEKKEIDFSFDEEKYRRDFKVGAFCPEEGASPQETNSSYPTVEINGMWGGYIGDGFKTIIPAKSFAKISCRLVSDQDPESILENLQQFILERAPKGAEIKFSEIHGAKAYRGAGSSFLIQSVKSSMEDVFDDASCLSTLCGGSVPIVRDLIEASEAEATLFGFALSTDDIHAPNEHFHWECFTKGFMTVARLLYKLSEKKI